MRRSAVAALAALAVGAMLWVGATHRGSAPRTVTYYVAADEVEWDYAPTGRDLVTGQPFDAVQRHFVDAGPRSLGRLARKALYREYADSSFATRKPRAPEWEYLGFLGPLLRAEVGDTIRVVFRNNTSHAVGMHPHGVFYEKSSEGAPYDDGTAASAKGDDAVPPRGTHVYVWPVPERAGPAAGEGSSVFWMYHSHAHEVRDVNAGLLGPMIIARRGATRADGTPKDVDREIVLGFIEVDENNSLYLDHNIRAYMREADSVRVDTVFGALTVGRTAPFLFKETLNGFLYGNLPMPQMQVGERVRWYLMGSTNFEFHSPHWHGNTVTVAHMRTDVTALLPMGMVVADMTPDNPGVWLIHCHVGNHLLMGMQGRYEVVPRGTAARAR